MRTCDQLYIFSAAIFSLNPQGAQEAVPSQAADAQFALRVLLLRCVPQQAARGARVQSAGCGSSAPSSLRGTAVLLACISGEYRWDKNNTQGKTQDKGNILRGRRGRELKGDGKGTSRRTDSEVPEAKRSKMEEIMGTSVPHIKVQRSVHRTQLYSRHEPLVTPSRLLSVAWVRQGRQMAEWATSPGWGPQAESTHLHPPETLIKCQ